MWRGASTLPDVKTNYLPDLSKYNYRWENDMLVLSKKNEPVAARAYGDDRYGTK